jgi:hypothetical protein
MFGRRYPIHLLAKNPKLFPQPIFSDHPKIHPESFMKQFYRKS